MTMQSKCQLLLFTRYPETGKTKTRLIPELGATAAALLQKKLTEKILSQADLLRQQSGITTVVHYSGGNSNKMSSWLGSIDCITQSDGNLGQKMCFALERTFDSGVHAAVLIGSDIPDITVKLLQQAFTALHTKKVVLGPSQDGGYYLIGLVASESSRLFPLLFDEMPWSTDGLLAKTIHRLQTAGYDIAILPTLRDIDLPEDLPFARKRGLL